MPNLFPENILFSISKLRFTAIDANTSAAYNFSLVSSGDKIKIEQIPPGILPDKMVINFKDLKSDIEKLINIFTIYRNRFDLSSYTDLANDLSYAIKELPKFRNKLKKVLDDAASKMTSDIFQNQYAGFRAYSHVEMLFSKDFKTITSIRLLGSTPRSSRSGVKIKRFVMFNVPNENLDINLLNLVYKAKRIINYFVNNSNFPINARMLDDDVSNHNIPVGQSRSVNFTAGINPPGTPEEFVTSNFIPPPAIHEKKQEIDKNLALMGDILKDFSPKTYDLLNLQHLNLSDLGTQNAFAKVSEGLANIKYFESHPLTKAIPQSKKNEYANKSLGPLQCLLFLWDSVFCKLDICQLVQMITKMLVQMGEDAAIQGIADAITNQPVDSLFSSIDRMPSPVKSVIYLNLDNEDIGLNLQIALNMVSDYVATLPKPKTVITCSDPTSFYDQYQKAGGISELFKQLKREYPEYYPDIEKIFNQNFARDAVIFILKSLADLLMAIDFCNFNLSFTLPSFQITDLWQTFSINLLDLLIGLLCELVSLIFELLISMLTNLNKIGDFLNDFLSEETENIDSWQQYVDYAFYFILTSNRAETANITISNPAVLQVTSTPEFSSAVQAMNNSVSNPNSSNTANNLVNLDYCEDNVAPLRLTRANYDDDIEYRIPGVENLNNLKQRLPDQLTVQEALDKVANFNYCEKYDFFTTNNIVDSSTLDIMRQISNTMPPLFSPIQPNTIQPISDKNELANSLKTMFKQIQSVLSKQELSDLINNNYSEEVASVVRTIAKINFPNLTVKIDPIKYFTMLGKVVGKTVNSLKNKNIVD